MLVDANLRERITTNGECFVVIYRSSKDNILPPFLLTSWSCDTKQSVVCEQDPTTHISTSNPPKFPCIPQQPNNSRKKRQSSDLNGLNNPYDPNKYSGEATSVSKMLYVLEK